MPASQPAWRQPLPYVVAAAVLFGVFGRFKGLGTAPFAVDEYYLARSIENILRAGIPAFKCGGFYMRGLILQYAAAAEQLVGIAPELAPRLVSAFCSLIALPAVFLLGRRVHGRLVGLLAVIIIALSVWEIEMARFGRMYAPFQAVFLWYLVFFLRYTVDRDARALWPMILLSIVGPFVWEGGVFLALANLLCIFLRRWPDRLHRSDALSLAAAAALLGLAAWFVTADFRGYVADAWPAGYVRALSTMPPDPLSSLRLPLNALRGHPSLMIAAIFPLTGVLLAIPWVWSLRGRPFAALGLFAALLAAVAHQFLAVAAIGLLLLLTRLVPWKELFGRRAAVFHVAVLVCAAFWIAFAVVGIDWHHAAGSLPRAAAMLGYQLLSFPDVVGVVVRPWARAIPHLSVGLLLLLAVATYWAARDDTTPEPQRILLITLLVLLLSASASHPPREETRYVFFLYPVAVIVALGTLAQAIERLGAAPAAVSGLTIALALGGFALSEDFQPRHVLRIDSDVETFRLAMNQGMQSHLVIRDNYRAIAQWLERNAGPNSIVVNGVHGLDRYYSGIKYFFTDQHDSNFADWSCRRGTVERWGNYPLLNSTESLASVVNAHSPTYLVTFRYDIDRTMASLSALHAHIAMTEGNIVILELQG
jgi:hypothetical protein